MIRDPEWKARTVLAALVLPPLLSIVSFARLAGWIYRRRPARSVAPPASDLAEWTDRLLWKLPRPWRRTCLTRSIVLYYLLRVAGEPVSLHIGVRRERGGVFQAHAWLTQGDGLAFESASDDPAQYRVIASFPEPPRA